MTVQETSAETPFESLVERYLDGALTDAERHDLESRLRVSASSRHEFRERVRVHALLRLAAEERRGVALGTGQTSPSRSLNSLWPLLSRAGIVAFAAMTLSAFVGIFLRPSFRADPAIVLPDAGVAESPPRPRAAAVDAPFAVIGRAIDVVWGDGIAPPQAGATVGPGRLAFSAGLLQIDFLSGVRLVAEGPAEIELRTPMSAAVLRGRVRCDVSELGRGFELLARDYTVIDLGTSFGLEVPEEGDPEVHVFDGKVTVAASQDAQPLEVVQRSAVRLAASGVERRPFTAERFPSLDSLDAHQARRLASHRRRWESFLDDLRHDRDLLGHYTFSGPGDTPRTARNHALSTACTDGFLVGGTNVPGRWAGDHAIRLGGGADRILFVGPGEVQGFTLAAWVRLDALPQQLAGLAISEERSRWRNLSGVGRSPPDSLRHARQVRWEIGPRGECYFNIGTRAGEPGVRWDMCVATDAFTPERASRWTFVAATHDGSAGISRIFVDGRQMAEASTVAKGPVLLGGIDVGNFSAHEHEARAGVSYALSAAVDELFVIRRPLSPEEISALHAAGSPD